jgi:ELWxxDGT repeat protein
MKLRTLSPLLLALLAGARVHADANPVYLVEDIHTAAAANPFDAALIAEAGGVVFFRGTTPETAAALWRSDGTPAGTSPMRTAGLAYDNFGFANHDGNAVFTLDDGLSGSEPWKSDGTPEGTVLLKDIFPGTESSAASKFTRVGTFVFFEARDSVTEPFGNNFALWKTDGTSAGTVLVKDVNTSPEIHRVLQNLTDVNGTLFFAAFVAPVTGWQLWKSNGTTAGTVLVKDVNPGSSIDSDIELRNLTNVDGTLFFVSPDGVHGDELWKSSGSTAGTVLVKDIRPGSGDSNPATLRAFAGQLLFAANDGSSGTELWKSDGTEAGTVLVKEIRAAGSSTPRSLTVVGSTLYFVADDGVNGPALWKTDGSESGTVLVKDLHPSTASSPVPAGLVNVNGTLYFTADDGVNGTRVWTSDGSEAGTVIVDGLPAGPAILTNANGTLYLTAGASTDRQLWKSDGTPEGSLPLTSVAGTGSASPHNLADVDGTLYFGATEPSFGIEPWKSDGTAAGTQLLKDIYVDPPTIRDSLPFGFTKANAAVVFRAFTPQPGAEPWATDGSAAGTVRIADIWTVSASSHPSSFTKVGNTVFFTATDVNGIDLWKTDGTSAGTLRVSVPSTPTQLTRVGGTLFFTIFTTQLWKSDGTEAGTALVKEITTLDAGAPRSLTDVNGTLFFVGSAGGGLTLWKSDGTDAGTVQVVPPPGGTPKELVNVNGTLFFEAESPVHGPSVWRSDGTEAGTFMVKDVNPATAASSPRPHAFVNADGTLFFLADDGTHGIELWKSDGTEAGTVRVPGGYRLIGAPFAVGSVVVFAAEDDAAGRELWISDGTEAGTRRVIDLAPLGSSNPQSFKRSGSVLYFTATTNALGTELYGVPVAALTDFDLDGLLDADERALGTDEFESDSDGDGLLDGAEVHAHGTNPLVADTDGDGWSDGEEIVNGTDPLDPLSPPVVPLSGVWGLAALAAALLAAGARARRRR